MKTTDETPQARDIDTIDPSDWPLRPSPETEIERQPRFQVFFKQSVLNEIHAHGRSVDSTEVCGVLVGSHCRDGRGPYLYIESSIRGELAEGRNAQVTFTAETWAAIQTIMEKSHPDKKIVGWYHTHPGFGIFLSGMDLFVHENFFNLPWQVAFVYDPKRGQEGLFVWRDGKTMPDEYGVEADVATDGQATAADPEEVAANSDPDIGGTRIENDEDLLERVRLLERRQRLTLVMLAVLAVVTVLWPLIYVAMRPYERFDSGRPLPLPTRPATDANPDL